MIAPTVTGAGTVSAISGQYLSSNFMPPNGFVRFNVTNYNFTGSVGSGYSSFLSAAAAANNASSFVFVGPLYNVPANATLAQPSIMISQINGVAVPNPPSGQYLTPDVQINANNAVNVTLSAANIPVSTVPTLRLSTEGGTDLLVACSALAGSLAASTSTCSATFPFSITIAAARATW
jgi:hypothetical protein